MTKRRSGSNLTFQQVYPLVLKRATAEDLAPAVHKRPQEDAIHAGPAPYVQREVLFHNFAAHNQIAGTLSLPNGEGPFPAVVLVSGTGQNTGDEDVSGHKVFLVLADTLNRSGFAVVRYDKRGVGGSSGDYDAATTADFASDAEAAVAWLKTQAEIDRRRIGVLGHSEGGIIAPAVAASDKSVAFVVMIAGPCIRGDRLFVLQSAMTAKAYGAPDNYIARRKVFDQQLYSAILSAPSGSVALDRAKALSSLRVWPTNSSMQMKPSRYRKTIRDPGSATSLPMIPRPRWPDSQYRCWCSTDHWTCRCLRRKTSPRPTKH